MNDALRSFNRATRQSNRQRRETVGISVRAKAHARQKGNRMTKLNELLERRAAALDTMRANEESGGEAFDKAKGEFDTLTIQIERAKLIDNAEQQSAAAPFRATAIWKRNCANFPFVAPSPGLPVWKALTGAANAKCRPSLPNVRAAHRKAFSSPTEALESRAGCEWQRRCPLCRSIIDPSCISARLLRKAWFAQWVQRS
ncbi:MAG: hypothetical protein IPG54_08770 [Sphingomonadales bacterium]|nr:hypothetical protein [Sphingomonadales bacterium]